MPADLESCVQQVMEKQPDLDESSAYAICQESVGSVQDVSTKGTLATFEDNGQLYLKAFLLDASVNINEWGVTRASLKQNINSFIGKPLVLTEDFDHPVPTEHDSLDHWLAYQETYRIGTIVDVVPKDDAYYALIEVTNADAKRAFQEGHLPNYVSPAIAQDPGDAATAIVNWTGVHLAIVDEPAYTIKKAYINGSCGGDSEQCLLQLRKARVAKKGLGCGFCNYQVLSQRFTSLSKSEVKPQVAKLTDDTKSKETTSTPAQPETKQEETVPKSAYTALEKKLADAELKVRELSETNQSISAQVADIQLERRREKIERIVTAELIKDEKKRSEKINAFVASSIPLQEIQELYDPALLLVGNSRKVETRTASVQKPHVTLGSNDNTEEQLHHEVAQKLAKVATIGGVL